ncbi:MAG: ferrous iron transport protein A [Myxococcota bacterium]|jgi:ferrous iron transport protein A
MRLDELAAGATGHILEVAGRGAFRRRLLELGLVPGTAIERIGQSPLGDPLVFRIRGAALGLRRRDAANVAVEVA